VGGAAEAFDLRDVRLLRDSGHSGDGGKLWRSRRIH
jgi:hypothetical protein